MAGKYLGPQKSARFLCALAVMLMVGGVCAAQDDSSTAADWPIRPREDQIAVRPRRVFPISTTSALRELIPAKYQKRYLKWKNDYLSTEVGRTQWERYTLDPEFTLTIIVSAEEAENARVDDFVWDDSGKLIAASIVLGSKLDSGYPSSINYPITCSLAPGNLPPEAKGTILAATKLAHEFGHVKFMMSVDGRQYQLQNRLMVEYNQLFFANGRDASDPQLLELVEEMGGTPVSIAQDRESWAEVGAIVYLQERLRRDRRFKMPTPIRQAIESYNIAYPGRAL